LVKISHRPLKEIIVSEVIYFDSPEKLAHSNTQPVILQWAVGIVFSFNPIPLDTDKLVDDFLDGITYWGAVGYSLMPEYHHTITVRPESGGTFEIGVQDVSMSTSLVDVASWLKEDSNSRK